MERRERSYTAEVEKDTESNTNNVFCNKKTLQRHVGEENLFFTGDCQPLKGVSHRSRTVAKHHFVASNVITGSGKDRHWMLKPLSKMLGSKIFTVSK